jgi:hypothetical protein
MKFFRAFKRLTDEHTEYTYEGTNIPVSTAGGF